MKASHKTVPPDTVGVAVEYLHFAGVFFEGCLGVVGGPSNPLTTPCGWGVPQSCPRCAPELPWVCPSPPPKTVLLTIKMLPPARGKDVND